ncbi:hypothetical protein GYH30_010139 [Glycine max]|uniref:Secreted protein n=1 Tax=Glycine max TaxID=3847 RepID=A0A0R0KDW2_SOYBN|nr:hypothetical protein GYH30_010139 [Glycine max]
MNHRTRGCNDSNRLLNFKLAFFICAALLLRSEHNSHGCLNLLQQHTFSICTHNSILSRSAHTTAYFLFPCCHI